MSSVRWAFRCGSWTPSRSEWLFAARCIQQEEKDRIGQFVFAKDAKSAMVGLTCDTLFFPILLCFRTFHASTLHVFFAKGYS